MTQQDAPKVTITISHHVSAKCEEWVVTDDGGEFDDEVFTQGEMSRFNAETEARDDAACRAVHYQKLGREWFQEEI